MDHEREGHGCHGLPDNRGGLTHHVFSIEFEPDGGYIVFDPFYSGQNDNPKFAYQSIDPDGGRYVDWPSKLDSLGTLKRSPNFELSWLSATNAPRKNTTSTSS